MDEPLDCPDRRFREVIGLAHFCKFLTRLPVEQARRIIWHHAFSPLAFVPVMRVCGAPIRPVYGICQHQCSQPRASIQLPRIAMRVVPNWQPFHCDVARVERKRSESRPFHPLPVTAESRLRINARLIPLATLSHRARPVIHALAPSLPVRHLRLSQRKIVVLVVGQSFVFPHPLTHKIRR